MSNNSEITTSALSSSSNDLYHDNEEVQYSSLKTGHMTEAQRVAIMAEAQYVANIANHNAAMARVAFDVVIQKNGL